MGIDRSGRSTDRAWRGRARRAVRSYGFLALGDGNGGEVGVFGAGGLGGELSEQGFAALPMQFRFERAIAGAFGCRQRLIEGRKRATGSPTDFRPQPTRS